MRVQEHMAFLATTMYNNNNHDHKGFYGGGGPPMSPRISFSNDFAESQHVNRHNNNLVRSQPPPSSDFEFSVGSGCSLMSGADELFSKGRLLPFKDNSRGPHKTTTLRDELLAGDDDDVVSLRPPKGTSAAGGKWKGLLGLRKSHIGSKKPDKPAHVSNSSSQEFMGNEGSGCRDAEIGI